MVYPMQYNVYRKRGEDMELSIKIGKIKVVLAILRERKTTKTTKVTRKSWR